VITTRRLLHGLGRRHAWPRLLAAVAAPLALAGTALVPSAAATTQPASHTTHPASHTTTALSLPGLDASSYTVTLITGDQVRLTQASPGQYTATAIPATGPATQIDFQAQGSGQSLTSLQAIPDEAAGLISSRQVDPGLFDLQWLVKHGDTSPAAQIPVTVQFAAAAGDAALRSDAAKLPGATISSTTPATGQVAMTVTASKAASFWAALTGQPATTSAAAQPSVRPATLADGVSQIWLTGHQVSAAASPQSSAQQSQDGQPLYTVTETITGSPAGSPADQGCLGEDTQGNLVAARFCTLFTPQLWGVVGGGADQDYQAVLGYNNQGTCISETAASPYPVCNTWQFTYTGVPAGIYYAQGYGTFLTTDDPEGTLEGTDVEMDLPQFNVTGNTSITMNTATAVPVTVTTPQPTWHNGLDSMEATRILADGSVTYQSLEDLTGGLADNWWAIPAPPADRATLGSYHFSPELSLTAPMVTAAVTAPTSLALNPVYTCDDPVNPDGKWCVRFSGRHTLALAYAGQGTEADFAKIDARGKLVMLRPCIPATQPGGFPLPGGGPCNNDGIFSWQQLVNAQSAGAAGVLLDAGTQGSAGGYPATNNPVPVSTAVVAFPATGTMPAALDDFPFAVIDASQAGALNGLLAKGPVSVTISDSGETPYAYNLWPDQEAQLGPSEHYTFTRGQLTQVSEAYNYPCSACGGSQDGAPPVGIQQLSFAFEPDDAFSSGIQAEIDGPRAIREYYGPLSPDKEWLLDPNWLSPGTAGQVLSVPGNLIEVFDQPGAPAINWNQPPVAPGAPLDPPGPGVQQAQPNRNFDYCAGCRQGNTFWPVFYDESGASPSIDGSAFGFAPGSIQLYDQAGQELQPATVNNVATFQLPAAQARYKLVTPGTTWDFTSAEPATDDTPPGTGCEGTSLHISTAPCQADPLVFLDYDAFLSTANTITPGTHLLQVTGYHQDPSAPPVTSLRLWTSTNGGTTWTPARVIRGWRGTFKVIYTVPGSGTNGYVSIKAQASDAAGNNISQVIQNAYAISH
jgi:hypothetical protein